MLISMVNSGHAFTRGEQEGRWSETVPPCRQEAWGLGADTHHQSLAC